MWSGRTSTRADDPPPSSTYDSLDREVHLDKGDPEVVLPTCYPLSRGPKEGMDPPYRVSIRDTTEGPTG